MKGTRALFSILALIFCLTAHVFGMNTNTGYDYIERPYRDSSLKGKVHLGSVYFAPNSWKLDASGHKEAMQMARSLSLYTQYNHGRQIKVYGFADQKGESQVNLQLGLARAEELARVLEEYGAPMANAVIASWGETHAYDSSENYRKAELWIEPDPWGFVKKPAFVYIVTAVTFIALLLVLLLLVVKRRRAY